MNKTTTLLVCCSLGLAAPAAADEVDKLTFALEVTGHLPGQAPLLGEGVTSIAATDLNPPVHAVALNYGVVLHSIASELVLRTGYGFASGSFPEGSMLRDVPITGYDLQAVPVSVGWRMIIGPSMVRFFAGLDIGVTFASFTFKGTGNAGEWNTLTDLRGLLGFHIGIGDSWGLRLFGEGRLSQNLEMAPAPSVVFDSAGFGAALVMEVDRPEPGSMETPKESGESMLRTYDGSGDGGMQVASDLIRQADEAARTRDFIRAEELYRDGVRQLPRDPRTRRNLEVPVRVDWAKVLIEVGRSADAREVLLEAQRMLPDDPQVNELLEKLGAAPEAPDDPDILRRDMPTPFPTRR